MKLFLNSGGEGDVVSTARARFNEVIDHSKNCLLELSKEKPIYSIPEEDTIIVSDCNLEFIGSRPYYEFVDGNMIEKIINH